jgi:S1-C subfamily serine protease
MDDLSKCSVMLKPNKNNCNMGQGTGFIVKYKEKNYLVSNRHVLTGYDSFTGKPLSPEGDIPNVVNIRYICPEMTPKPWLWQGEKLYKDGNPRWIDKKLGSEFADIAILPLDYIPNSVEIHPLEFPIMQSEIDIAPGMPVYTIGYPAGITVGGGWPIWITGHLASDFELNHGGRPVFLINSSSEGGLSGSPVYIRSKGETQLLGVHSSTLQDMRGPNTQKTNVCVVWRSQVLQEVLDSIEE